MTDPRYDFNSAARIFPQVSPQDEAHRLETLRSTLQRRAPELIRELFPLARIQGNEARIGDAMGTQGESMSIALAGDKAGQWKDHNPSAKEPDGDLITLWRMGQGYDTGAGFWRAVEDLEQHVGLANRPAFAGPVARVAAERAKVPKPVEAVKVSEIVYTFPSADEATVLARVTRRDMSDGSKRFLQQNAAGEWKAPEVRPLYNLPAVAAAASVVLVEGEKCADALMSIGVTATTAMGGAGAPLDKTDWSPLAGRRVILWPDNDLAGLTYMGKVAPHLRALGCDVSTVTIPAGKPPKWDAADADAAEVGRVLATASAREPRAVRRFAFMTMAEVEALRPPPWLIKPLLPAGALSALVGGPGTYKSFIAMDWGLSLAYGLDWLGAWNKGDDASGFRVTGGGVLYIAGEGQASLGKRFLGWKKAKGLIGQVPKHRFDILGEAVAMPTGDLEELLASIADLPTPPALIILDTLARSFGVGDENSSQDMGKFVAACDRLRRETGACVLVVHHSGKDTGRGARGSSALLGALDVLISVERKPSQVVLRNRSPHGKMKDAEEFEDIMLACEPIQLDALDDDGDPMSSLVLIRDTAVIQDGEDGEAGAKPPSKNEHKVLMALQQSAAENGPPLGLLSLALMTGVNRGTLSSLLPKMLEKHMIEMDEDGGRKSYRLPEGG